MVNRNKSFIAMFNESIKELHGYTHAVWFPLLKVCICVYVYLYFLR